jgi:hypothetical protein
LSLHLTMLQSSSPIHTDCYSCTQHDETILYMYVYGSSCQNMTKSLHLLYTDLHFICILISNQNTHERKNNEKMLSSLDALSVTCKFLFNKKPTLECYSQSKYHTITQQQKSHLCITFLGIARPQSQFPHSCVCERIIHSQDRSTYFLKQNRHSDWLWEHIHCSQTYECGNWDCVCAIPFLGIFVWIFGIGSLQCIQRLFDSLSQQHLQD